jgi:hypothetical protein
MQANMEGYGSGSDSECESPRAFDEEPPSPTCSDDGEEPMSPMPGADGEDAEDLAGDPSSPSGQLVLMSERESGLMLQRTQHFRQLRLQERELTAAIARQVEQETEAEQRAAEQALEALRVKRHELLKRADIRAKMQEQQRYADELEDIGDELKLRLRKLVRAIMREESMSEEQKMQMVEEAHRRAACARMDEEERAVMEQLQTLIGTLNVKQGGRGGSGCLRQIVRLK